MDFHEIPCIFMEFIDILREYATCPPPGQKTFGGAGCTLLKKINELQRKSMIFNKKQWIAIKINEFPWKSVYFDENQWISMKINTFLWKSMNFYGN